MERAVSEETFLKLPNAKERILVYTAHAVRQARKRGIISDDERTVPRFEKDLQGNKPYKVVEQDSENTNERKFKVYFQARAPEGGFMAYIVVLNKQMRLISIYRTSKKLQETIYNYERSLVQKAPRERI